MIVELHNTSTEPIFVKWKNGSEILQPCQMVSIVEESNTVKLRLSHQKNNKFNLWWYLLNAVFTLEQMRTVLVVDGEYIINGTSDFVRLKIKDYEYVFEKHTSYQTFVFSVNNGNIVPKKFQIAHGDMILKKAKFLYLFGGIKTLLPITCIALFVAILRMISLTEISYGFLGEVILVLVCFILLLANYIRSLKLLRRYIAEENVFRYLSSDRKENRKTSDEIVQKYLDVNAGDDVYR